MNKKDIAFWIMIITIICLVAYLFNFIRSESYDCISSPLTYGVSKYKDTQGEFTCTCSSSNSPIIFVTKENISIKDDFFEKKIYDTFIK